MGRRLTEEERRERERKRWFGPQSPEEDESPLATVKWEAAAMLGLLQKVRQVGWGGLTAAESGRVGGYMTKLRRERGELPPPEAHPSGRGPSSTSETPP